jgi:hypothetical protein
MSSLTSQQKAAMTRDIARAARACRAELTWLARLVAGEYNQAPFYKDQAIEEAVRHARMAAHLAHYRMAADRVSA